MQFEIGCSGFHYKHWRGKFYPEKLPQKKWFEFYCQYFNTLELNVTFYRFPQLSVLEGWYDRSSDSFRFAVKAPRGITHYKKFLNAETLITPFYDVISKGLREKLGCVLFQMPPNFRYSEENLDRIINSLDHNFKNVVEFRHESWWQERVYHELGKHSISFCGMSHPEFPQDIVTNAAVVYYRMHGKSQLYASDYSDRELSDFAETLKKAGIKEAYVYFNNDINGFAITNAQFLQRYFGHTQTG